jgi:soluble lytic murein transglycosylase-like protein
MRGGQSDYSFRQRGVNQDETDRLNGYYKEYVNTGVGPVQGKEVAKADFRNSVTSRFGGERVPRPKPEALPVKPVTAAGAKGTDYGIQAPDAKAAEYAKTTYKPLVDEVAAEYGEDPGFVMAMFHRESKWDPEVASPTGPVGIGQFDKATARDYGLRVDSEVDERKDPEKSIRAGVRYVAKIRSGLDEFELPKEEEDAAVLASYNAGPTKVRRAVKKAQSAGTDWRSELYSILGGQGAAAKAEEVRAHLSSIAKLRGLY